MNIYKYLVFFMVFPIYAQTYEMKIVNGNLVDQNNYEFEVIIKTTDADFELTSYQCIFKLLNIDVDNIEFSYINNSSTLSNKPSAGIGVINKSGKNYLTFASAPGNDIISSEESIVGKFRITSESTLSENIFINWEFEDAINTILTGAHFVDITNSTFHLTDVGNQTFLSITNVNASSTTDLNTSPEKTFDGIGYNDGDLNARWAAQPLPQWIAYDFGAVRDINFSKISFYKFNENRIYTYSISVSSDNINWVEVVSNAQSSNTEWTINNFDTTPARYFRIDLHSSTNNPDNWAGIWEVEFWGSSETTHEREDVLPTSFELHQNYPNPFNPSTKIRFSLREEAFVNLTIYNQLGEIVEELVHENLKADNYEVNFNAQNLASGVYFYKLNIADKFSSTKKMLLMK